MDDFAPPRTRRSHPSLHHLSLNPLTSSSIPPTPSSPTIAPTIPSSYISPATTLPLTYPSILSRSSSRTKLRSPGPTPVLDTYQNTNSKSRPGSRHHSRRGTPTDTSAGYDADSSWLTRTASTLAMHSMEERGQSWLASRNSATSLHHHRRDSEEVKYDDGAGFNDSCIDVQAPVYSRSTPASRYASRVQSRVGSRVGSRSDLRMTATKPSTPSQYDGSQDTLAAAAQGMGDIEPDFVDLDERDWEEEEVVEVMDEGEIRKLILGRVGGWVDWMVGWMDLRGLGDDDGTGEGEVDEKVDEVEEKGHEGRRPLDEDDKGISEGVMGLPAPELGGGAWEDAKWLLKVAANSL
ncbi:MAG: hypothetical protein L6R42_007006 [Xanthoria sp. 1 TBL-2021]|nr:MAG: hypothetical protein L6R42_007006 [Xanthoria sp. 1 TBL-2021]